MKTISAIKSTSEKKARIKILFLTSFLGNIKAPLLNLIVLNQDELRTTILANEFG